MPRLSLALPHGADPASRWHDTAQAHASFLSTQGLAHHDVRPVVLESWQRSAALRVDPDQRATPVVLVDDSLAEARATHPLRLVMPVVRQLLVEDASDAGVVVVVGDADGRALWAEGDPTLIRRAEGIHLVAGAAWSEQAIGTNAIGTALAIGEPVQVFGSEHFVRSVQPWSCTASPVHDPSTGDVIGFLDITGGNDVAAPQSAFLVRSAVAAMESELRLAGPIDAGFARPTSSVARLAVLGRDKGVLALGDSVVEITLRHTELLLMLAAHPDGISASELAWQMYEHDAAEVTVRAEMSRLRRVVPTLVSPSRPYRLLAELRTDAAELTDCLLRGDHAAAVRLYRGDLLPRSTSPGVITMRYRLHAWLRNVLLDHGDTESLLTYAQSPAGRDDVEIWRACRDRLSSTSPRQAEVNAVLADLDGTLGVGA